jgi:hypothetical protein
MLCGCIKERTNSEIEAKVSQYFNEKNINCTIIPGSEIVKGINHNKWIVSGVGNCAEGRVNYNVTVIYEDPLFGEEQWIVILTDWNIEN